MPKKRRETEHPPTHLVGDPPPLVVPLPLVELETAKAEDEPRGLVCLGCGCRHLDVDYTRPKPGGRILRRRICRNCGRAKVTVETEAFDAASPPRSISGTLWRTIPD